MSGILRHSNRKQISKLIKLVAESKFMNTSQLNQEKRDKLKSQQNHQNLQQTIKINPSQMKSSAKKYEGYDYPMKQSTSKVVEVKQKDNNIEEEYIRGLQEEIKYLEYELKLLKDKEIEEQQQYSQLDKFFQDGVPLNENILQMKNQYNSVKEQLSKNLMKIEQEQIENRNKIEQLQSYNEKMKHLIQQSNLDWDVKFKDYVVNLNELRRRYFNDKHYNQLLQQEIKELQANLKIMQQYIIQNNRKNEKELILQGKLSDILHQKKVEKENREHEIIKIKKDLEKQYLDLTKLTSPILKSKIYQNERNILNIQKEINLEKNKKLEYEDLLIQRKKQRENDNLEIISIKKKIEKLKERIEKENQMNDQIINDKVNQCMKEEEEGLRKQISQIKNTIGMYFDRIKRMEEFNEGLIEINYNIKQQTIDEQENNEKLQQDYIKVRDQMVVDQNTLEVNSIYVKELIDRLNLLQNQFQSNQAKINPLYDNIQANSALIDKFVKQKEMITQFRKFNIEELKMLASSNNQINQQVTSLINKWEQISSQY